VRSIGARAGAAARNAATRLACVAGIARALAAGMHKRSRTKLHLDTQTIRNLDLKSVAGALPKTTFISVLMQCDTMTCPSYSCFVDETCINCAR
jgi:hypothetical protein